MVLQDLGQLTAEERGLGFDRFPRLGGDAFGARPTGKDVLDIAAAWGLDPRFSRRVLPPSSGWLCTMT